MKCIKCGEIIAKERLDALPTTQTCVKCSDVQKRVGITIWNKTTPTLVIVDENEAEEFQRLERGDGRSSRLK